MLRLLEEFKRQDIVPVLYLESGDVNKDGTLKDPLDEGKVVVMIKADFCGACKMAFPSYVNVAEEGEVVLACIMGDKDKEEKLYKDLVKQLGIKFEGFPTYLLFENGKFVRKKVGALRKEQLLKFIL